MRWLFFSTIFAALGTTACEARHKNDGNAETAGPHFANLCVEQNQWPVLIRKMNEFSIERGLQFHGGIDHYTYNHKPKVNAYVAQGYSYFFGDDFDIWFVGDPVRRNVIYVNGIVKQKPITSEQSELAKALMFKVRTVARPAGGHSDNPNCDAEFGRANGN